MKKLVSLALVLAMMFSLGASALAADISTEPMEPMVKTINEYDIYVKQKEASNGEYSVMSIDGTTEKTIEELYLERAALSEEELVAQFGYSKEQIAILKAYDGSPIEENPQLRAVSSNYTESISKVSASRSKIAARLNWSLSQRPFILNGTSNDTIICIPETMDTQGVEGKGWNISGTESYSLVYYAGYSSGQIESSEIEMLDKKYVSTDGGCHTKFVATAVKRCIDIEPYDDSPYWAKSGSMVVTIVPGANYSFESVCFAFSYMSHGLTFDADKLNVAGALNVMFTGSKKLVDVILTFIGESVSYSETLEFDDAATITYNGNIQNNDYDPEDE